jgi:hypothetical protein
MEVRSASAAGMRGSREDTRRGASSVTCRGANRAGRDDLIEEGKAQQDQAQAQRDAAKKEADAARGGADAAEKRQEAHQN